MQICVLLRPGGSRFSGRLLGNPLFQISAKNVNFLTLSSCQQPVLRFYDGVPRANTGDTLNKTRRLMLILRLHAIAVAPSA